VENLVNLSDIILFSAAIPNQGGDRHVNEQWPSYWVKKFKERGYVAIDPIRGAMEKIQAVQPFYIQNLLIYVKADAEWPMNLERFRGMPFLKNVVVPHYAIICNGKCSWKHIWQVQKTVLHSIKAKLMNGIRHL